MVTSNQQPDKKVAKMAEQNNTVVVPQRTLLGEVNEHITCPLCRGYYIDATTIVECLHSFCRSCIIKHLQAKSYCPVCEMMINSAKPNIKLDKALQDIVYKLVPGLFQKEMERRQQFYASRPGPAACATPEQRGEDTERIIFSPEDVISFSLEYCDVTDADSISSKSSDSNESQPASTTSRRYLQCPAVVNISHLKKFLSMKFDIDSSQFAIDILYKRVPLPDYYTLMDIAYIYNWKRNEPMRFFYQIIDYIAIRNRLFDINRKSLCPFGERKPSPAPTEDTNASSPAPHLNEQGSEASSGTDSPMLDERLSTHSTKLNEKIDHIIKKPNENSSTNQSCMSPKKNDDDVEKSQFLNSFELTAKSNCLSLKTSPLKSEQSQSFIEASVKTQTSVSKVEEKLGEASKRKYQVTPNTPEIKKLRVEIEKTKITNVVKSTLCKTSSSPSNVSNKVENPTKCKENEDSPKKSPVHMATQNLPALTESTKETKQTVTTSKPLENPGVKRPVAGSSTILSPKRKPPSEVQSAMQPTATPRTVSPLKLPIPKPDMPTTMVKSSEVQKPLPSMKKMPDLKPSVPMAQSSQNKVQPVNKVRMDLLANNSDFTKPKSSLSNPSTPQTSGDPLKSLFDSCKINIPSSLSITLTDQKQDARNPAEAVATDSKKNLMNKNLSGVSNTTQHKVPSPPVHNYIEILKLPDTESKKPSKPDGNIEVNSNQPSKLDTVSASVKPPTKSSESSAKGPIPNLKPIADTKLAKQVGNFSAPITFQQTFEQQLQSLQSDKKTKGPKNKAQVPKLVPATPKSFNTGNKPGVPVNKTTTNTSSMPILENKPSTALDLSTPHNIQNQLLTMQSIDNLAKKQNLPSKGMSLPQTNVFPNSHRPMPAGVTPLRIPSASNINLLKPDKSSPSGSPLNSRHDISNIKSHPIKPVSNVSPSILSPGYQPAPHTSPNAAQPSPRSQTRSPSSSPKLVIAEEKQANSTTSDQNINQSTQITSTQIPSLSTPNNEMSKIPPGPSKTLSKPIISTAKSPGVRQPLSTNLKPSPNVTPSPDYLMGQTRPQLLSHNQNMMQLRHQMEMNAWAQRHIDIYKNMAHQIQNEFNNKDKQQ